MKRQGNYIIWSVLFVGCLFGLITMLSANAAAEEDFQVGVSQAPDVSFEVDSTLKPAMPQVPGLDNEPPRPLASLAAGQAQADFVENELLVMSDDTKAVEQLAGRWKGKIVGTVSFQESQLAVPSVYLIQIDAGSADTSKIVSDFRLFNQEGSGLHRVSSEAGLRLIAAAAKEKAAGFPVSLNFVLYPSDIAGGTTSEAASAFSDGWDPDAFSWAYINQGSGQNIGIGAAWQELQRRGRLGSRVRVAVLDNGFDFDRDVSPTAAFLGVTAGRSGPFAFAPFHGANVADTLMALPDNNWGAAGAAGPIGDPIIIDRGMDMISYLNALSIAAGARAQVVNMSFGADIPAVLAPLPGEIVNSVTRGLRARGILLFAAAPNNGSFDVDATTTVLGVTWENEWSMPCENDAVICVGGMGDNSRMRDPGSSFTSRFAANPIGIDIFGPFWTWVSEDTSDGLATGLTMAKKVSGNSFATPTVAGIAALILAANPGLPADEVERILLETGQRAIAPTDVPLRPDARAAVCRALGGCASGTTSGTTARFRITVNGFMVNRHTRDAFFDDDGAKDEVFLLTDASLFDLSTNRNQPTRQTLVMGDSNTRPERIRAGSATSLGGGNGGFQTGDTFPGTTPWVRLAAPTLDRPPLNAWEGELTRDRNALAFIPTIWESDIDPRMRGVQWVSSLANTWIEIGSEMRLAIARRSGHTPTPELNAILRRTFDSVRVNEGNDPKDRPIGMDDRGDFLGFTPQMLVLTYDAADRISRTDTGRGMGVLSLNFRDQSDFEGDYTLFVQVERLP